MGPRRGRPRTGRTPNISLRTNPDAYHAARIEAVTVRKTVGQWIADAIREKIEREKEEGSVTKADCEGTGDQPRIPVIHGQWEEAVAEGSVPALHRGLLTLLLTVKAEVLTKKRTI